MLQIAGHLLPPDAQVRFRFLLPHLFAIHNEFLSTGQTGGIAPCQKKEKKKNILVHARLVDPLAFFFGAQEVDSNRLTIAQLAAHLTVVDCRHQSVLGSIPSGET
jgi:hypothetical protein